MTRGHRPVLERQPPKENTNRPTADQSILRHATVLGILSGLATATQLRGAGSAGVFDILIILYSVAILVRNRHAVGFVRSWAGLFLLGFVVVGALGGLISVMAGDSSIFRVVLGLLPYGFAIIGLEVAATQDRPAAYLERWLLCHGVLVIGSQLLLLAAFSTGVDAIGPIELFVGDRERKIRFLGWTNNPNQLAMAATIGTAAIGMSGAPRWLKLAGVLGGLTIGLVTLSDGFRVALIVSVAVLVLTILTGRLDIPRSGVLASRAVAVLLAVFVLLNANWLIESATTSADDGDQAVERIELWSSCADAVVRSPLIGLGPGSHGALDGENRSCHNTFVEAATFAGVPMVLALLAMLVRLFALQVRRSDLFAIWFVVQASMQMVFSFFFRYPQLWMMLFALQVGVIAHQRRAKEVVE